jgi:hypothetical protein
LVGLTSLDFHNKKGDTRMKNYSHYLLILVVESFLTLAILFVSCQKAKETKEEGDTKKMRGTVKEVVDQLGQKTSIIMLGDSTKAVLAIAPEYGARVIGMSANGLDGENLLWVNNKIFSDSFWTASKRDWNLGGARTWIAPEDAFYLNRNNEWFVPSQMDPGSYKLEKNEGGSIVCSNTFSINNKEGKSYDVKITRTISVLDKPVEPTKSFSNEVSYVGLRFTHELENLSKVTFGKDQPYIGLWSLIQINPSGTMIIPLAFSKNQKNPPSRNYGGTFNDFPQGERMWTMENVVTVRIDGKFRGKIGFAPWACKGQVAYLSPGKDGNGKLLVKEFDVDPKGVYLDHPWGKPSEYGDAIQVYNDDGQMGGFAEMECHGSAKLLQPGQKESHTATLSVYLGKIPLLKKIAEEVLGLDMNQIRFFD